VPDMSHAKSRGLRQDVRLQSKSHRGVLLLLHSSLKPPFEPMMGGLAEEPKRGGLRSRSRQRILVARAAEHFDPTVGFDLLVTRDRWRMRSCYGPVGKPNLPWTRCLKHVAVSCPEIRLAAEKDKEVNLLFATVRSFPS
jgi:hypothetical protein